jgi:hypothetical protein
LLVSADTDIIDLEEEFASRWCPSDHNRRDVAASRAKRTPNAQELMKSS